LPCMHKPSWRMKLHLTDALVARPPPCCWLSARLRKSGKEAAANEIQRRLALAWANADINSRRWRRIHT
jgi:hypothetical protein